MEDQGWVAWFLIAHALRHPVTIFGDGKQTRDLLFIDDLIDAYCMAWQKRDKVAGQVYNIGGGPQNQFSIKQLVHWIEVESGAPVEIGYAAPRRGDQKVFVADIRKAFKKEELSLQLKSARYLFEVKHCYTQFKVNLSVFACSVRNQPKVDANHRWINYKDFSKYPLPSASSKIIEKLQFSLSSCFNQL